MMKCERCGCEETEYDNGVFKMHNKSDCISALKAKLAEKEPTKPDRFAKFRKHAKCEIHSMSENGTYRNVELEQQHQGILAAYDAVVKLIIEWQDGSPHSLSNWLKDYGPYE
jgi:hypothetical protein